MKPFIQFWFISFLLLFYAQSIEAQDLIVTRQNDSIDCKISIVKADVISFSIFTEAGKKLYTQLPVDQVNYYKRKYYTKLNGPDPGKEFQQLAVSLQGGYSIRTAEVPSGFTPAVEDYLNSMRKGTHLSAELIYYFSDKHGFGFKYSRFRKGGSLDDARLPDGFGGTIISDLSDDVSISFAGPIYSARVLNASGRNFLLMNIGIGYMKYVDEGSFVIPVKLNGDTFGLAYDLGYNIGITNRLSLGLQASLYVGVITEYYVTSDGETDYLKLEKEQYEGLGRLDLSARLSYRF